MLVSVQGSRSFSAIGKRCEEFKPLSIPVMRDGDWGSGLTGAMDLCFEDKG
jgi:hypothetical protein